MASAEAMRIEAITIFKQTLLEFKYDDFVEGEEPYILLDESTDDPQMKARFEQMLRKRATECGVPARMIAKILKERAQAKPKQPQQQQQPEDTYTDWEGQPITLLCGDYRTDNERLYKETQMGMELICPHPIMPTRRYININTGMESIEISFRREYWKSIIIEKGTLSNASTITQLANHGISVTSESAKQMVRYLSYIDDLNRDIIPIEEMSSHLGWIGNDKFVPYSDGITYDSRGVFDQIYRTIRQAGKYDVWLQAMKSIRAEPTSVTARIVMAASFASVLLQHFDALPFIVHLWSSQSGTGKTVAMKLAASVWADPNIGAYCRPIKSTDVGLEQLAIFTCNMPLCLDELQTIQKNKNFDDIIYGLCEGSGKTRGAKNGGIRNNSTWANTIITTGEMPIVGSQSKAGAANRVIDIECKGFVLQDAKADNRIVNANYGYAGLEFVKALIEQPELFERIEADQQIIYDNLASVGTDKQAISASILLAADHAAEQIIFKDGIRLSESDIMPFMRSNSDIDTGSKAHEYLLDWAAENRAGFIVDGDYEALKGRQLLGCVEAGKDGVTKLWIIGKAASEALASGGFNIDSYISWAHGKGILQTKNGSRKIVKHMPGTSMSARCICLELQDEPEFTQVDCGEDIPF